MAITDKLANIMIDNISLSEEWINEVSMTHNRADKILVEKVIRALMLLESLSGSGLHFCFKGGTCAMLMLGSSRRMSIDIDIIVPPSDTPLLPMLEYAVESGGFIGCEPVSRTTMTAVPKEHYKFFYKSALSGKENFILLDILREEMHYTETIALAIESDFLKTTGGKTYVKVPDFNNIIADKLTAFAPNTTGIPYIKNESEMGMEIMKQMYDIGCLFDRADDIGVVREVFTRFCETELKYRAIEASVSDALYDIIKTALSLCLRRDIDATTNFRIIGNGVKQVNSHIFSESFNIDTAVIYAAKTAYLAAAVKTGADHIERFDKSVDMKDWTITAPMDTKLNKIKKSRPEAFFYLWQMADLLKSLQ